MIISPDGRYHYTAAWIAIRQTNFGIEYLPGVLTTARQNPILCTTDVGANPHMDSLKDSIMASLPNDGYSVAITSITPLAAPSVDQQLAAIAAAR